MKYDMMLLIFCSLTINWNKYQAEKILLIKKKYVEIDLNGESSSNNWQTVDTSVLYLKEEFEMGLLPSLKYMYK